METRQLAILGLVGLGGYAAYRYIYLPAKFRALLAQQAAAAGMSPDSYAARLGAAGCQALGMYYKIPPSVSQGPCSAVGQAFASTPDWLTRLGRSAADSTVQAGQALGIALPAVGSGAGGLVKGVVYGVTDATVYGARATGNLIQSGASGAGSLFKRGSIGASMLPIDIAKKAVDEFKGMLGIGSSKLGRGSNGKDVFPNDMVMCNARGVTGVEACSKLYDLTTRKWAWD